MSILAQQVGGDHYKKHKIQPIEYITANNLNYIEGNIIKYVTRYKDKNGVQDLLKAKHYLDMLIEQTGTTREPPTRPVNGSRKEEPATKQATVFFYNIPQAK